jgi:hypothetical protein
LASKGGAAFRNHVELNHAWLLSGVAGAFAIVNSVRIVAYVPQIVRAAKDNNGASAISYTTWSLFLVSHLTTIAYAVVVVGDLVMALIFLGNAAACFAIIGVTFVRRQRHAAWCVGVPARDLAV